jgi:hypothetical protein
MKFLVMPVGINFGPESILVHRKFFHQKVILDNFVMDQRIQKLVN